MQEKPSKPMHKGTLILSAVVVVLVLGIGVGLLTGFVKVSMPGAAPVNAGTGPCKALITDYNKAFTTADGDAYTTILKDTAEKAAAAPGGDKDPNCVYMRFTNAVATQNIDEVQKFSDMLKELADTGHYITGELANVQGIDSITSTAKGMKVGQEQAEAQQRQTEAGQAGQTEQTEQNSGVVEGNG